MKTYDIRAEYLGGGYTDFRVVADADKYPQDMQDKARRYLRPHTTLEWRGQVVFVDGVPAEERVQ